MNALSIVVDERTEEEKVYEYLASVRSFKLTDLLVYREPGTNDRQWRQLVWRMRERLQAIMGIVYRPVQGRYVRADGAGCARRATSFARAFYLKGERVVKLTVLAAERTPDPEDRAKLERLALKRANQLVDAKHAVRAGARVKPKGV